MSSPRLLFTTSVIKGLIRSMKYILVELSITIVLPTGCREERIISINCSFVRAFIRKLPFQTIHLFVYDVTEHNGSFLRFLWLHSLRSVVSPRHRKSIFVTDFIFLNDCARWYLANESDEKRKERKMQKCKRKYKGGLAKSCMKKSIHLDCNRINGVDRVEIVDDGPSELLRNPDCEWAKPLTARCLRKSYSITVLKLCRKVTRWKAICFPRVFCQNVRKSEEENMACYSDGSTTLSCCLICK